MADVASSKSLVNLSASPALRLHCGHFTSFSVAPLLACPPIDTVAVEFMGASQQHWRILLRTILINILVTDGATVLTDPDDGSQEQAKLPPLGRPPAWVQNAGQGWT